MSNRTTDKSKGSELKKLEPFNPLSFVAEHQKSIKEQEAKLLEQQIQSTRNIIR